MFLTTIGICFLTSSANAKAPDWLNLSLSPDRLFDGVGELSTEAPLKKPWSIIGITAYGRDTAALNVDLGVQGRYYAIGTPQTGGFVATELRYANIIYRNDGDDFDVFFIKPGILLGGKYQFDIGLTIDSATGVEYVQTIVSELEKRQPISTADWSLQYRINIGWTLQREKDK